MSLGTPALSSTGGGGSSSTITSFLGSTTNAPMNITQIGGNAVTTTIPVSGTVTANAGTGTFNIQSNASVNIAQVGGSSFALGQALAAASLPVVLTASQLTTLTPPSNTGYALDSSLSTINTSIGTLLKPASTLTAVTTVSTVTNVSQINGISPTFNSSTFSAKQALDVNPLGTLGTAFTDAGKMNVQGGVATNTAVADKLLNLGAQAISSENSAVTATRMAQLVTDLVGKLIVLPYANPENFVSGRATATDTTSTSLIAAPASGLRNYITQITVWNSSAVSTYIKIQDGSGGTELYDIPAPAGGGATLTLPTPLRQPTTATAIFFAANASANAVFVSASGYKGA